MLSAAQRRDLDEWLAPSRPELVGWAIALLPDCAAPPRAAPEGSVAVYYRFTWTEPLPTGDVRVVGTDVYRSTRRGSVETGVRTETVAGQGFPMARALTVFRHQGDATPWGERCLPQVPTIGEFERRCERIVTEEEVARFARLTGTSYLIHADPAFARALGYPDILVPGPLLLMAAMQRWARNGGGAGDAEMWFRAPVPVGVPFTISERSSCGGGGHTLTSVELSGTVVAIARLCWLTKEPVA